MGRKTMALIFDEDIYEEYWAYCLKHSLYYPAKSRNLWKKN